MMDGSSGLSSIGVDFDAWTEDSGITIANGAVFWMDPGAAEPLRDSNDADPIHTVLAHITVPTGEDVTATFGEVQGRSHNSQDWKALDIVISNREEADGPGLRIDCARTGLDISNWQDIAGDGCEQYAMNGWCCPESSPHCNEEYAVDGVDSDGACCASCSQSIGAFSVYANFSSGQHTFTMRRMRPSGAGRKFRWRCAN